MPFLIISLGVVLAAVAYNNTQDQLMTALQQDLPGYFKWAGALGALSLLGFVPGMRDISRMLIALVLVVIILKNYQQVLGSFTGLAAAAQQTSATVASSTPVTPSQQIAAEVQQPAGFGSPSTGNAVGQLMGTQLMNLFGGNPTLPSLF